MKALTIQEPCASAIAQGYKHYETRSWKTNYRGPLIIHSGLTTFGHKGVQKQAAMLGIQPQYGYALCKANLVDCILMDKKFLSEMLDNRTERNLGIYEEGRYAWVLENVEPIEPIKCQGHLGLWDFK